MLNTRPILKKYGMNSLENVEAIVEKSDGKIMIENMNEKNEMNLNGSIFKKMEQEDKLNKMIENYEHKELYEKVPPNQIGGIKYSIVRSNDETREKNICIWDDESNCFSIREDGEKYYLTNDDIIDSIYSGDNKNNVIKKFFFIIGFNKDTELSEFNFVDSIFTDDINLMIKVQNLLFEQGIKNINDNLSIFNYQFVIYLFKKQSLLNMSTTKISKFYSTITYRFSSLILKHLFEYEKDNVNIQSTLTKLLDVKKEISMQLENIEKKLNSLNNPVNVVNEVERVEGPEKSSTSDSSDFDEPLEDEISNKSILSSDTLGDLVNVHNTVEYEPKQNNNENIDLIKKIIKNKVQSTDNSFNPHSATNNGVIYNVDLW